MKVINSLFLKGLIVVTPITITLYVLFVILNKAESIFGNLIKGLIGPNLYIPGFGILVTIILMVLVGLLVSNYVTGNVIKYFINLFERFPIIKAIYNPLRDLISLFGGGGTDQMKKVVMVNIPALGGESIGLVTRDEFNDLKPGVVPADTIAVYIPMSYMMGGFTALVPRSSVREVDIPVEQAFKLALTGWIKAEKSGK